jgi:hypothetical protein
MDGNPTLGSPEHTPPSFEQALREHLRNRTISPADAVAAVMRWYSLSRGTAMGIVGAALAELRDEEAPK